jgi:RloB-like protein
MSKLPPRETLLVVCEGAETERVYFEALRRKYHLRTVDVVICPSDFGTDPTSVVKCAIHMRNKRKLDKEREDFDHVWSVIDTERYSKAKERKLCGALDLARRKDISVAVSNPCFEFWFLLHFDRFAKGLGSCSKAVTALKKYVRGYKKATNIFDRLDPLTDEAIAHAESINKQWSSQPDPSLRDPSTNAHEIVKLIRHIHGQGPQFGS